MTQSLLFDPLVPMPFLIAFAAILAVGVSLAIWRGLSGWWLRALAGAAVLGALANPSLQFEEREPLSDILLLVIDESASQSVSDRPAQAAAAVERVQAEAAALGAELRVVRLGDGEDNRGTLLMEALQSALAEIPGNRLAGAILLTDGRLHDIERAPEMQVPLHVLLTGRDTDWDRRLVIRNAPAFAIIDEPITLTLRIEDQGDAPQPPGRVALAIAVDGAEPQSFEVPIGEDLELPVTLRHGGSNVIRFEVPEAKGEITARNNSAIVQINGVRDRLRVLLVSGEPHAGERTWRNLLKSDASVDLVHFTILRPPEKQDGVPVTELSLIAFPTRELFLDKIEEFDLIIFDRYQRRGILPSLYLDNVRSYVESGGAVLVAAGPDFASASSLYRSPLGDILPGAPTGRVIEDAFRPTVTEIGQRHPVTQGMTPEDAEPQWGRWLRQIDVTEVGGTTVMEGAEGRPLLLLDRVGEGRVALLASDHAWLWSRGYEGGGPQLELLRRLAHWMMKEPELEEETLSVTAEGQLMSITRRTLGDDVGPVEIERPDGSTESLQLQRTAPGLWTGSYEGPEIGLYRLTEWDIETVVALGPAAPREFEETIADAALLEPSVDATRGGVIALSSGEPDIREVRQGRVAAGRGWIGITPRDAYLTTSVTVRPVLPAWAMLLLVSMLAIAAWLVEGRGTRRR